jgi:hypothetical protein
MTVKTTNRFMRSEERIRTGTTPRFLLGTRLAALALLPLLILAACSDSPTEPPPGADPASVEVSPEELALTALGETGELTAAVLDEDGEEIPNATVTWSSSDEEVATVDEDGVVEAVGEGSATITAVSGEVEGTAEVTVSPDD